MCQSVAGKRSIHEGDPGVARHSTFNVTANFYSHLDFHSKVESAETIAKVLGGDSTDTEQAIHDKGSEDEKNASPQPENLR